MAVFTFLSYTFGFLSWNSYLLQFGFFEYEVLQTRFFSAGILFFVVLIVFTYFVGWISKILGLKIGNQSNILLFLLYFFLFFYFIFPWMPQSLGGARPFSATIIAPPSTLEVLSDFGAFLSENGGKPQRQTAGFCIFYLNPEIVLFGIPQFRKEEQGKQEQEIIKVNVSISRFLVFDREQIFGFEVASFENCPPTFLLPYTPKRIS